MDIKTTLNKWHVLIHILPYLIAIFVLKVAFHFLKFEIISLNALFTSLIAATTFLIGFLITGVISDYKESEKIPGELAASLSVIYDEAVILDKNKKSEFTREFIEYHKDLTKSIEKWLYKKITLEEMIGKIDEMNNYFSQMESMTQAGFILRMKTEQNNIRKQIIRIDIIRETDFVQSAYAILEALAFFLIAGLLFLKLEPFYEAAFFATIVSFLVLYMIFLIKDLDNPFEYDRYGEGGSEVSLKPLNDVMKKIEKKG